jgi:hypothetical protein
VPEADGGWALGSSSKRWSEVWAVDGTINTSDVRLKEDVSDITYGLREVMRLRPISFRWRERPEAGLRLGLLAQEVEPVLGEVVAATEVAATEGEAGPGETARPAENLGIYYAQLVPVLIKAVQEQQGLIDEQAAMISRLEARVSRLEMR